MCLQSHHPLIILGISHAKYAQTKKQALLWDCAYTRCCCYGWGAEDGCSTEYSWVAPVQHLANLWQLQYIPILRHRSLKNGIWVSRFSPGNSRLWKLLPAFIRKSTDLLILKIC